MSKFGVGQIILMYVLWHYIYMPYGHMIWIYAISWCMSLYLDIWQCETEVNTSNSLGQSIRQLNFDHRTINPCLVSSDAVSRWFRKLPEGRVQNLCFESLRLIAAELMMASCLEMVCFLPLGSVARFSCNVQRLDWGSKSTKRKVSRTRMMWQWIHRIDRDLLTCLFL